MIDLTRDRLTFTFPRIHPDARLEVECQRTLRIPHGASEVPRLPSLGRYPLYSVEDYAHRVPRHWLEHGGAMLPMYQSEAMWLSFRPAYSVAHRAFFPFAVKLRIGSVDAVSGRRWVDGIHPGTPDFLTITDHSWLGGFDSGSQGIRQFVAMPLGSGYLPGDSASGPHRFGRLELTVYPMSRGAFELRYPHGVNDLRRGEPRRVGQDSRSDALRRHRLEEGLFPLADWEARQPVCFALHLVNSLHWCAISGGPPPMAPVRLRSMDHPNSPEPGAEAPSLPTSPPAPVD